MYILRTIETSGDYVELAVEKCVIRACSMAELLSDKTLYGNVVVTDTKRRQMKNFANGKAV